MFWGTDSQCGGPNPGPAVIHSTTSFPPGDGRFTLEVDLHIDTTSSYRNAIGIGLHNNGDTITYNADTNALDNSGPDDYILLAYIKAGPSITNQLHVCQRSTNCYTFEEPSLTENTWMRMHMEIRAEEGFRILVTQRDTGTPLIDESLTLSTAPPPNFSSLNVQLRADGPGKWFDNLVVYEGL